MVTPSLTHLGLLPVSRRLRRNPEVLGPDLPWGDMPVDDFHSLGPARNLISVPSCVSWPDTIPIRIRTARDSRPLLRQNARNRMVSKKPEAGLLNLSPPL